MSRRRVNTPLTYKNDYAAALRVDQCRRLIGARAHTGFPPEKQRPPAFNWSMAGVVSIEIFTSLPTYSFKTKRPESGMQFQRVKVAFQSVADWLTTITLAVDDSRSQVRALSERARRLFNFKKTRYRF